MEAYSAFAKVYDRLMEDAPYDVWIQDIKRVLSDYGKQVNNALELACGTGNLTIKLSKLGYNVTGIDISPEMLSVAKNKALTDRERIDFLNQDICDFNVNKKFDLILCICDGVNYIIDKSNLEDMFDRVYDALNDDGIFVFDVSSYYKLKNILGNNNISEAGEDVAFIWENFYDEEEDILEFDLSIFVKSGNLYERYNEEHIQRAYKISQLKEMYENKFETLKIFDENYETVKDDTERIFFALKKIVK